MALTPLVSWAQRHREIYLRVELTDAENIQIHVHENVLHFKAQGLGAKGQNQYQFSLDLFSTVKPQVSCRSTQRQVTITVQKEQQDWWDRLTRQDRKPLFLIQDLDRWMDQSQAETEIREKEEKRKRLKASRHKDEGFLSLRTAYLVLYNLVQFLGFSWIFANMTVRLCIFGQDSLYDTFYSISDVMFFCQTLAIVEPLNAAVGLVPTWVLPTLLQILSRLFVLFVIINSLEEMHHQPIVFFIFYLWSNIEIFRYPFYLLSCFNVEWKTLTWLRYNVWILLYPLGFTAEVVAIIQSFPVFDQTGRFSLVLLDSISSSIFSISSISSISFSYFLYVYLLMLTLGSSVVFRHLLAQRKRRFGAKKKKSH